MHDSRTLGEIIKNVTPVLLTGVMVLAILITIGMISCLLISVLIIFTQTHLGVCGLVAVIGLLICYGIYKATHIQKSWQQKDKTRHNIRKGGESETQRSQKPFYQSHVV